MPNRTLSVVVVVVVVVVVIVSSGCGSVAAVDVVVVIDVVVVVKNDWSCASVCLFLCPFTIIITIITRSAVHHMTSTSDGTSNNCLRLPCGTAIADRPTVWVRRCEIIISKCDALEVYKVERQVLTTY